MTEIPEDIRKAAAELYAGLNANNYSADCDDREQADDVDAIAAAILAERNAATIAIGACKGIIEGAQHQERRRLFNLIEAEFSMASGQFIVDQLRMKDLQGPDHPSTPNTEAV